MSNSLKADVMKAVKGNAPTKNDTTIKLKSPQVLKHSLDSAFKSPQKLNENTKSDIEKNND